MLCLVSDRWWRYVTGFLARYRKAQLAMSMLRSSGGEGFGIWNTTHGNMKRDVEVGKEEPREDIKRAA